MKVFFIILIFIIPFIGITQINFYATPYDSLKSDYRIEGAINDIDNATSFFDASFLITNSRSSYLSLEAFNPGGSKIHAFRMSKSPQLVSPLPHIGFSYFFGTQGAQKLGFEYQQVFRGDWVLNTAISTMKSGGFFRNTSFSQTNLDFGISKKRENYGVSITGRTSKIARQWSGGVVDASLLEVFAPLLVPVNKSNCNSELKYFGVGIVGYLRLINREKYTIGITHESSVDGNNRLFSEQDTLSGLYTNVYFDTLNTTDQYQFGRFNNTSLVYFKNSILNYSLGVSSAYWNYRNMNLFRDTFELDLLQELEFSKEKFRLKHKSKFNTIGASHTWEVKNDLRYKNGAFTVLLLSELGQKLPEVYQRYYSSNNVFYSNTDLALQTHSKQALELVFKRPMYKITTGYALHVNRGVYMYDMTQLNWSNSTELSSSVIQQAYIKSSINHKKFSWRQVYRFSLTNTERLIVPRHQLDGSIITSVGIFKAKRLKATFGLTYNLNSRTSVIPIIENMGQYNLLNISTTDSQKGLFNMGAMVAVKIETFRFFVKFSNIGYFWNSTSWQYIDGIYLPELTLRVGLTWDFWN
ncbi:MAG: hypothetical protein QNL43_02105 [Crocinitomicaceae bacterium]|jgi:hypothetical protein|tara:strand:- start:10277 stop:12019 length:1743 start_codon:yes stop_codon:yes gene_type:complete